MIEKLITALQHELIRKIKQGCYSFHHLADAVLLEQRIGRITPDLEIVTVILLQEWFRELLHVTYQAGVQHGLDERTRRLHDPYSKAPAGRGPLDSKTARDGLRRHAAGGAVAPRDDRERDAVPPRRRRRGRGLGSDRAGG